MLKIVRTRPPTQMKTNRNTQLNKGQGTIQCVPLDGATRSTIGVDMSNSIKTPQGDGILNATQTVKNQKC